MCLNFSYVILLKNDTDISRLEINGMDILHFDNKRHIVCGVS